ncbi:N-acetylneuraminate synthase family protein [Gammaproteobacteria bacterium]|nr:N-acetylneuraminate synthase family protein [Gammaproteobacteria bacterium]
MNPFFYLDNRKVGYDENPLIIAEIGINHNGSLEVAKNMARTAIEAGVDVVKHQTHIVEDEMSQEADKEAIGYIGKTIYQLMKECALNEKDELELMNYVHDLGGIFISTPFSRAAADRLERFNVPAYKIGSGECNNYPLLEHIAGFGKPIILSTGMNTIDSISKAVDIFENNSVPYAILHTTNIYPTPAHLVRLGAMDEIRRNFPQAVIGLSDHTTSNHACFGAVALGACILERHYTDVMDREGPDILNSMDPSAAKELVEGSKILKQERGGIKGPIDEEKPVIDFAYASVVTIKDIKEGDIFSKENLWVKRPGTGPIFAEDYKSILGKKAANDISNDIHLKLTDIVS